MTLQDYVHYLTDVLGLEKLQWAPEGVAACTISNSSSLMVLWSEAEVPDHHFWGPSPATDMIKKILKAIEVPFSEVTAIRLNSRVETSDQLSKDQKNLIKKSSLRAVLVFGENKQLEMLNDLGLDLKIFQALPIENLISAPTETELQKNKKIVWDQLKELTSFLRAH